MTSTPKDALPSSSETAEERDQIYHTVAQLFSTDPMYLKFFYCDGNVNTMLDMHKL